MNNACRAEIERDNFDIAETLCKANLGVAEHAGTDSHDLAVSIRNLADVFVEQDKPSEAEALYQRALTIYGQIKREDSLEAASVMEDLGDLYIDQKKFEQAEPYFRRAMEIRTRTQGSDAMETTEVRDEYEKLLRRLGRKP